MVYGFVRRSRGHVKIYSERGSGTVVRLYLPRAHGRPDDGEPRALRQEAMPEGDETILVVDDEPDLIEVAARILAALGYRTLSATNGPEALDNHTAGSLDRSPVQRRHHAGRHDGYRLGIEELKERPTSRSC
jgi:hypothetical protein